MYDMRGEYVDYYCFYSERQTNIVVFCEYSNHDDMNSVSSTYFFFLQCRSQVCAFAHSFIAGETGYVMLAG